MTFTHKKIRRFHLLVVAVVLFLIITAAVVGGLLWSWKDSALSTGSGAPQAAPQYLKVKIGSQTWMAKNLDVSTFRNGDPIPEAKTSAEWRAAGGAKKPAWSYYNNQQPRGNTLGKLYNWYAVNDPRGLCPKGWHVPTSTEWDTLVNYLGGVDVVGVGGVDVVGGEMKEPGTAHWESPNKGATNISGFTALPGGARDFAGDFFRLGYSAFFWSAGKYPFDQSFAWNWHLNYDDSVVYHSLNYKENGFSVRCVRD